MIKLLKKIDAIVIIIIFTICVGVAVITMRSNTYTIGYEIAALKNKEKQLHQRQSEIKTEIASTQRYVRDNLLAQQNKQGKTKYILPDASHVIREN